MVKTMRGQNLDINSLIEKNKMTPALTGGGIPMNARGDILGPKGIVVKTAERIMEEYNKNFSKQTEKISIKDAEKMRRFLLKSKFMTPEEIQEKIKKMEEEKEKAKKISKKIIEETELMYKTEPIISSAEDQESDEFDNQNEKRKRNKK